LTCFITLEEFYVRSCAKESSYKKMLEDLRIDYKDALENSPCVEWLKGDGVAVWYSPCVEWLKGDGVAVWYNGMWQRGMVSARVPNGVDTVEVFLIDVGATVAVDKENLVPLCDIYHQIAPYAVCCTVGPFRIYRGRALEFSLQYYCIYVQKRFAFAEMCKRVTDFLMESNIPGLDVEIHNKIWDERDKWKVKLTYKDLRLPDCFVQENLITLK
uniref:Tudor domain-containing protein n=1 Tax=Angiostrongylus cantonensis TaxID=6313 RepID=A0A0K0DRM9_ANGCA